MKWGVPIHCAQTQDRCLKEKESLLLETEPTTFFRNILFTWTTDWRQTFWFGKHLLGKHERSLQEKHIWYLLPKVKAALPNENQIWENLYLLGVGEKRRARHSHREGRYNQSVNLCMHGNFTVKPINFYTLVDNYNKKGIFTHTMNLLIFKIVLANIGEALIIMIFGYHKIK